MNRTAAVVNLKGGTAMGMERDAIAETFQAALGNVEMRFASGGDLPEVVRAAFDDPAVERVILAGGDGTASLGASHAVRTDKPFGIVPLGTMNLFARTIAMPLDLDEALEALAAARIGRVDCGKVNQRVFINHVSLGFHPQLIRMRDAIPRGSRLKRMWNGLRVYLRLASHHRKLRLALRGEFPPFGARAGLVVVTVNPIDEDAAQIPHPDGQDRGEFGVYVSTHRTAWDLNKVVWRLLAGTLRESEHIAIRRTGWLEIDCDTSLHMSVDGEVVVGREPLRFDLMPRALKVMLPPAEEELAETH